MMLQYSYCFIHHNLYTDLIKGSNSNTINASHRLGYDKHFYKPKANNRVSQLAKPIRNRLNNTLATRSLKNQARPHHS